MDTAPALPARFPCWCRAVYSWGGESKKDLGFIEGDLIECLNAGDGQWWMGRLRRDKRAMGLFPSNFVKVLDEDFVPMSRESSPMTGSVKASNTPPKKEKSVFRKPFQAYSATLPETKKPAAPAVIPVRPILRAQDASRRSSSGDKTKTARTQKVRDSPSRHDSGRSYVSGATSREYSYKNTSFRPNRESSLSQMERAPSPSVPRHQSYDEVPHSRQNSYQYAHQSANYEHSRDLHTQERRASYNPSEINYQHQTQDAVFLADAASALGPPPPQHRSRAPSLSHYNDGFTEDSMAPPPPPPHRVMDRRQQSGTPPPEMNESYHTTKHRTPSPLPASASAGMTPSPLRDAMDDVLDSLQDMSADMSYRLEDRDSPEQRAPINPWSPEAFEELRTNSRRKTEIRAHTSMGLPHEDTFASQHTVDSGYGSQTSSDGWKERMESRLVDMRREDSGISSNSSAAQFARPTSRGTERPFSRGGIADSRINAQHHLKNRKSAFELGKDVLGRKYTTKSITSNITASTHAQSVVSDQSNHTLMSGHSAGAFSATSAGSFARRKFGSIRRADRPISVAGTRPDDHFKLDYHSSQASGPSYHPSHPSQQSRPMSALDKPEWVGSVVDSGTALGGLTQLSSTGTPQLKSKRSGFLRKLVDSARAGAATARNTMGSNGTEKEIRRKSIAGPISSTSTKSLAQDMGLGGGNDWMEVRRDVYRSNSLSYNEQQDRRDRCELMNQPAIAAVDQLQATAEGEEGLDGMPIAEPVNFRGVNMQLVDKAARFITNLSPTVNAISLAQGYLCRPYRSDAQRLRAIFTWVSERVTWEEDSDGPIDTRKTIQTRRGCAEETSVLVAELCQAVGLHAEVVNGYLKPPGELPVADKIPEPNHWWNAVLVDGEWRIMDCALASPSHPRRSQYSSVSSQVADSWYFLMRPLEACYTHIPAFLGQQHIVPPISPYILLALPCACPPFFKHGLRMVDYDTSQLFLSDLEVMHLHIAAPSDVELWAEVETRGYARDADGDTYESGEIVKKRALAQAEWVDGTKSFTIKAVLPSDERHGRLLIYAGKKGLMHSTKDNPHSLALSLPIVHDGQNPVFDFFVRHPTPHAQRHDLYVAQPQCYRLVSGHTFVFAVRQHPSSIPRSSLQGHLGRGGATSPLPFRPGSALSMSSNSVSGSNYGPTAGSSAYSSSSSGMGSVSSGAGSATGAMQKEKPAKLAIQSPSGKIMRMSRKHGEQDSSEFGGGTWEAYIKIGEKGTWRGLVLADRSARWCVFGEWQCV